jgi:hypothetical protein
VRQPVIDSKGVNNRRNRQNRNTRRNLLPNCYQNMQVGSGLNRGGSAPSVSHLNNLIFSSPGVSQSMTTSAFWRHYFRFAVIHPQSEASPKLGIEAGCSCYKDVMKFEP